VTLIPGRTYLRAARLRRGQHRVSFPQWGRLLVNVVPRLGVRSALLATLIAGPAVWHALTSWSDWVLLLPMLQALLTLTCTPRLLCSTWDGLLVVWATTRLSIVVGLLLVSTLEHGLGLFAPLLAGHRRAYGPAPLRDFLEDETEIYIESLTENQYHIVLRGRPFFLGTPDSFEEVLLSSSCVACDGVARRAVSLPSSRGPRFRRFAYDRESLGGFS